MRQKLPILHQHQRVIFIRNVIVNYERGADQPRTVQRLTVGLRNAGRPNAIVIHRGQEAGIGGHRAAPGRIVDVVAGPIQPPVAGCNRWAVGYWCAGRT